MARVHTPIGVFDSQLAASKALKCDRRTLVRRMKSDPDNYWTEAVNIKTLPAWSEYRVMAHDVKEEIYQSWCAKHKLDPDLDSTANAFFDAIDAVGVPESPEVEEEI